MAWPSAPRIRLTKRQRRELVKLAARTSAPPALVQRARMILQRRVLKHASFTGVPALRAAVLGFIRFWNLTARPFRWTFTGDFAQAERQLAA